MNTPPPDSDDELQRILREAHPPVELPPRFQEAVWRRIEAAQRDTEPSSSWLDSLISRFLRPAFATAALAILILTGGTLGVQAGKAHLKEEAQARYISTVSPFHRIPAQ